MKVITMLSLALFSFVHNESYVVEKYSCENNQIKIQYEQNWYDFSLFNVFVQEESDICTYLEGDIKIEFEPLAKIEEPLSGYIFVNGELLQKTLVSENLAEVKIENPNYKYDIGIVKEAVLSKQVEDKKKEYFMQSKNIALALIALWVFILLAVFFYKRKKDDKKDIKRDENVV